MYESTRQFSATAIHGVITIQRNEFGIPKIAAQNREDLLFGVGYAQANDRLAQMMQLRAIALGKTSEHFAGTYDLIELDKYMRWIWLEKDVEKELDKLTPAALKCLKAYTAGINQALGDNRRPLEFWLLKYHPEKWKLTDTFLVAKLMSYLGLAQTQGDVEKFIIQLIQQDVAPEKIQALFPHITEEIDTETISKVRLRKPAVPHRLLSGIAPNLKASNNWVVSGKRTLSGKPILASDPHLEINRLPPLWYEMHWDIQGSWVKGATLPGVPVTIFGRSRHLSWGNTYGFMDMIDWYMEECHDEQYKVDGEWRPFEKRVEIIHSIGRDPEEHIFYENHHGVLDGEPTEPGIYLTMAYAGRDQVGAEILNTLFTVDEIRTVEEAQQRFRELAIPTFNWLFADTEGNTGYQMCGRMPKRHDSISGLLPVKGWKSEYDWKGFVDSDKLPNLLNSESGFFATANTNMNDYGLAQPINMSMAPYRRQRIIELLQDSDTIDAEYCKTMHFDTYSKQAERFMPHIEPFLPDTANSEILRNWDCYYTLDSVGAALFESVYTCLIDKFFGSHGFGTETLDFLRESTTIFTNYYGNFDEVILDESSVWMDGLDYEEVFQQAVIEGLDTEAKPYGHMASFKMNNIFLGEKLPAFFGFDENDIRIAGNRATIPQLQFFSIFGNETVVGQSYRMIADMSDDTLSSTLPGGPSGKRFSRWYRSDLNAWKQGDYKKY